MEDMDDMGQVARETSEELRAVKIELSEGFDMGSVLMTAKRWLPGLFACPC